MTRLYLCEKPSQAADIAKVIMGKDVRKKGIYFEQGSNVVTWAVGHVLRQAMPEEYDEKFKAFGDVSLLPIVPEKWKMLVSKGMNDHVKYMRALIAKADEVVIACDAGREGELIAREILDFCNYRGKVLRLWLQALDEKSIKDALTKIMPGERKVGLYHAGLCRARSDWLIGMNLSRIYSIKYGAEVNKGVDDKVKSKAFSVGRIQSPTLALVVRRDAEIESFTPKKHFGLRCAVAHDNGTFMASLVIPDAQLDAQGHCVNVKWLDNVAAELNQSEGSIASCETKREIGLAPLPYDLSTLQQEVSKRLGVSASKVLELAQALYEKHKITTYPRVDCRYLAENQFVDAAGIIQALLDADSDLADARSKINPSLKGRCWNDKKVAESDHHAIMPRDVSGFDMSLLSKNERVVFEMIRNRFLMQFAANYEFDATKIVVRSGAHALSASGSVERVLGWKGLFGGKVVDDEDEAEDAKVKLPPVEVDDLVRLRDAVTTNTVTKPPAPFTESTLLRAMESVGSNVQNEQFKKILNASKGLGTPATRASFIDRLIEIGAITKEANKKGILRATTKGKAMIRILPDMLTNPETTAVFELFLGKMEKGEKDVSYEQFMAQYTKMVCNIVEQLKSA